MLFAKTIAAAMTTIRQTTIFHFLLIPFELQQHPDSHPDAHFVSLAFEVSILSSIKPHILNYSISGLHHGSKSIDIVARDVPLSSL
jgi:hypothetical protein